MQVCAFVGLCDGSSAALQQPGMHVSRRLQAGAAAHQAAGTQASQKVGENPLCPFCTTAVAYIKVCEPAGQLAILLQDHVRMVLTSCITMVYCQLGPMHVAHWQALTRRP